MNSQEMKGRRPSPSKSINGDQDYKNLENPHLSSAYIRSQSTSRTKTSTAGENISGVGEEHIPRKKQVRRRVQARKPYQEKNLDMAEARREIVTALKLHRAAMKKAGEKQPPRPEMKHGPEFQEFGPEQEARSKSRRNPRIYASNHKSHVDNYGYGFPYSWPASPSANLNLVLPSQTLGLNLNLRDFNIAQTSVFRSSACDLSVYSSSSPSISCSPPPSVASEDIPYMDGPPNTEIGPDQYDCLNFEISAGRAVFLDIKPDQDLMSEDFASFDEFVEFPAWMNADVGDFYGRGYYHDDDLSLPCMEIEEIEGMDGDWLASNLL